MFDLIPTHDEKQILIDYFERSEGFHVLRCGTMEQFDLGIEDRYHWDSYERFCEYKKNKGDEFLDCV